MDGWMDGRTDGLARAKLGRAWLGLSRAGCTHSAQGRGRVTEENDEDRSVECVKSRKAHARGKAVIRDRR